MNPFETLSLEHSSTVDRVAEELRRALFDGDVEAGTALREVALADAMSVSRSTIREALTILVGEGLATREPNRGVSVTELDAEAVHDLCLSREVLESAGVRRWTTATADSRHEVRRAFDAFVEATRRDQDPFRPGDLTASHLAIHRAFVGLTESPRLLAHADAVYSEIRLALAKVDRIRRNAAEQVESHRVLVELLEAAEIDGAVEELGRHLAHAESSMLEALEMPPNP